MDSQRSSSTPISVASTRVSGRASQATAVSVSITSSQAGRERDENEEDDDEEASHVDLESGSASEYASSDEETDEEGDNGEKKKAAGLSAGVIGGIAAGGAVALVGLGAVFNGYNLPEGHSAWNQGRVTKYFHNQEAIPQKKADLRAKFDKDMRAEQTNDYRSGNAYELPAGWLPSDVERLAEARKHALVGELQTYAVDADPALTRTDTRTKAEVTADLRKLMDQHMQTKYGAETPEQTKAATVIQTRARQQAAERQLEDAIDATTKLQAVTRGRAARKVARKAAELKLQKTYQAPHTQRETKASEKLQRTVRAHQATKQERADKKAAIGAVTNIQALRRGVSAKNAFSEKREARKTIQKNASATLGKKAAARAAKVQADEAQGIEHVTLTFNKETDKLGITLPNFRVTEVAENSPADGKLRVGDEIIPTSEGQDYKQYIDELKKTLQKERAHMSQPSVTLRVRRRLNETTEESKAYATGDAAVDHKVQVGARVLVKDGDQLLQGEVVGESSWGLGFSNGWTVKLDESKIGESANEPAKPVGSKTYTNKQIKKVLAQPVAEVAQDGDDIQTTEK